jgi:hypothetical protein
MPFIQQSTSGPVAGSAEYFVPITVTGEQTATLLPGETADVTLTFTNPNSNVSVNGLSFLPVGGQEFSPLAALWVSPTAASYLPAGEGVAIS